MTLVLALGLVLAQLLLPHRLGFLPLLIAVFHQPNISIVSVGGLDFSITRVVIAVGLMKAMFNGALFPSDRRGLDSAVLIWCIIAVLSAFAQKETDVNPLTLRLGMAYNFLGTYLYVRYFLSDKESIYVFSKALTLVLLPLVILMAVEKVTTRNAYARFAGVSAEASIRDGRIRAKGPFSHAILAGTAGASSLPLTLILWRRRRSLAILGAGACGVVTFCSGSSGPILTFLVAISALVLWHWRDRLRPIRRTAVLGLIGLHLVMQAPVWYLMARVDLTGSSTGYHRARLIDGALAHLNEWWLIGTSYTRHWMVTGVSWSADHTDITNHYLKMGVIGGLPLMFAFVWILTAAFRNLGQGMSWEYDDEEATKLMCWCVGATLFAHSVTFLSVSYFDQIGVLLCFGIGITQALADYEEPELEESSELIVETVALKGEQAYRL